MAASKDALTAYWRDNQRVELMVVMLADRMGVRRAVMMVEMKVERMEPQTAAWKAARMVELTGYSMAASMVWKMVDQLGC